MESNQFIHKNYCRMCLLVLKNDWSLVEVNDEIKQNFFDLIRVPLNTTKYAFICEICNEKLYEFSIFQRTMIDNQKKLLQLESEDNILITEIKIEDPVWIKQEILDYETYCLEDTEVPSESQKSFAKRKLVKSRLKSFLRNTEEQQIEQDVPANHRLCSFCAEILPIKKFYTHMRKHKIELNQDLYQCDNCDYKHPTKALIAKHVETHFGVRVQHKCSYCSKIFLVAQSKKDHERRVHLKYIEKHECACGKTYPTKSGLYNHKQKVHNTGSFPCPKCDKIFNCRIDLNAHNIKIHKPKIACEVCGILKAPGLIYSTHMKTHSTGEFCCSFEGCDKKFKYKHSRDYHFKSEHETPEGFNCPTCKAAFKMKRQLNRHVKRQHESNTMVCEVPGCCYTFKRKEYIVRHISNHRDIDDRIKNEMLEDLKTKFKFS